MQKTNRKSIRIHVRTNKGEDIYITSENIQKALNGVKKYRVVDNHMVCILEDEKRILRWDRVRAHLDNKWQKCPVDHFEILGKIAIIKKP